MNKNFQAICYIESIEKLKDHFEDITFPCYVLVGKDTVEAKEETILRYLDPTPI